MYRIIIQVNMQHDINCHNIKYIYELLKKTIIYSVLNIKKHTKFSVNIELKSFSWPNIIQYYF